MIPKPSSVVKLYIYQVFEFFWGTAVKERRSGRWIVAYLKPDGREINLEGCSVEVHENGIEFL